MADSPAEKKKTDSTYWRNVAFVEARAREVARRRSDLWQALAKFIHTNGASVVSLPNAPRMRIEMRQDSNLVNKLKEPVSVRRIAESAHE